MKTVFERYLEESLRSFDVAYGKELTVRQIMKEFFPEKIACFTQKIKSEGKNAIVMLGKSCCGKTTFARKFCQDNPEFTLVSMDECAANDLEEMTEEERHQFALNQDPFYNDLGNRRFGNMIADGSNIIIDGDWGHINARGALLRTLDYYGYFTTIVSMTLIPETLLIQRREKRVLNSFAKQLLEIDAIDLYDKDYVKVFAEKKAISYEKAIRKIRKMPKFQIEMAYNQIMLEREDNGACWEMQEKNKLFFLGADAIHFEKEF